jgi:flavin reductase (DIM6/NTAB) family NADH-FMN oxidoreductase RutF
VSIDGFVAPLDYPMYVVTAADPDTGERAGCLVGFATQGSIDPGRLLVCLSKANHTHRVARRASTLAVHLLGADQRDLAVLFGTRTGDETDKFAGCAWQPGPAGAPLLTACPHRLLGTVLCRTDLGDHDGFLLSPTRVDAAPPFPPLLFSAVADLEAGHPA